MQAAQHGGQDGQRGPARQVQQAGRAPRSFRRPRQRAAVAHVPGQTQYLAGGVALVGRSQHHRAGSGLQSAAQDQGEALGRPAFGGPHRAGMHAQHRTGRQGREQAFRLGQGVYRQTQFGPAQTFVLQHGGRQIQRLQQAEQALDFLPFGKTPPHLIGEQPPGQGSLGVAHAAGRAAQPGHEGTAQAQMGVDPHIVAPRRHLAAQQPEAARPPGASPLVVGVHRVDFGLGREQRSQAAAHVEIQGGIGPGRAQGADQRQREHRVAQKGGIPHRDAAGRVHRNFDHDGANKYGAIAPLPAWTTGAARPCGYAASRAAKRLPRPRFRPPGRLRPPRARPA